MLLGNGELAAGPWRSERLTDFARLILKAGGAPGRPPIAALDGRSASGKTSLAPVSKRWFPAPSRYTPTTLRGGTLA